MRGNRKPPFRKQLITHENMSKNIISSIVASLVVAVIVCALFLTGNGGKSAGGTFNTIKQEFNDGFIVNSGTATFGSSGSALTQIIKGTCNLVGGTIAATSSAAADCAVTGVQSGDLVFATLATSTAGGVITGARASSTSGYITVRLLNLAGGAKDTTFFGTSTAYVIIR